MTTLYKGPSFFSRILNESSPIFRLSSSGNTPKHSDETTVDDLSEKMCLIFDVHSVVSKG